MQWLAISLGRQGRAASLALREVRSAEAGLGAHHLGGGVLLGGGHLGNEVLQHLVLDVVLLRRFNGLPSWRLLVCLRTWMGILLMRRQSVALALRWQWGASRLGGRVCSLDQVGGCVLRLRLLLVRRQLRVHGSEGSEVGNA